MNIWEVRNLLKHERIENINLRVTYYARVSTLREMQLNSLSNQKQYYETKILNNPNWTLVEGYIDEGITGTHINKREEFQIMIDDAKQNKFDLIITKEISRFARNTIDSIQFTRDLLQYGVGVIFEEDGINTLDGDSELRLTIMAGVAQDEVRKLSKRVSFGNQVAISNGHVLGNNRLFGYDKKNCKLVINEYEAEMIRKIYNYYVGGLNTKRIEDKLYEEGYRNRNNKKICNTTIRNIIRNPKYKGYFCGNKVTTLDVFTQEKLYKDKSEWLMYKDYDTVPPIVDEELWEKANRRLDERGWALRNSERTFKRDNLFTSKIICTVDKTKYYLRPRIGKNGENKNTWVCSHKLEFGASSCNSFRIPEEDLIKILQVSILGLVKNFNKIINEYVKIYEKVSDSVKKETNKYIRKIESLEEKRTKLLNMYLDNRVTEEDFKLTTDKIKNDIEYNQELIGLTESEDNTHKIIGCAELKEVIQECYNGKSFRLTQHTIDSLVDQIYITPLENNTADIEIVLKTNNKYSVLYNKKTFSKTENNNKERLSQSSKLNCYKHSMESVQINRCTLGHHSVYRYQVRVIIRYQDPQIKSRIE